MKRNDFENYSDNELRTLRKDLCVIDIHNINGLYLKDIPEKVKNFILEVNSNIGNIITRKNRCVSLIN